MSSRTTDTAAPPRQSAILHGVVAAGLSVAASLLGGLVTRPQIPGWYAALEKPFFNPPNWVFGPVWTLLFAMMALAFWRVLQRPAGTPGRGAAIVAHLVQMALNVTWSVVFFGLNSPAGGFLVIGLFLVAIGITIRLFASLDRPAAWLLAPYLAWVSFASVLNASIWWLNA